MTASISYDRNEVAVFDPRLMSLDPSSRALFVGSKVLRRFWLLLVATAVLSSSLPGAQQLQEGCVGGLGREGVCLETCELKVER